MKIKNTGLLKIQTLQKQCYEKLLAIKAYA